MNQKLKKLEKTLCDRIDSMMDDKKYEKSFGEKRRLCAEIRSMLNVLEDLYDIMAEDEDEEEYEEPVSERGLKS